jgi:thiol:disulfide interchange protein
MEITWKTDVDAALAEARQAKRPVLIDFTAAPL